jgi:predicted Fe-Mo cluster-binding NifX family protein/Zn finger protein HypA/HybF involved in hydrogenase expression
MKGKHQMDDLNGVQGISAEELRLLALKNKIKWLTVVIVIAAIAIAGMLAINFYPELFRKLLGDQERGDLSGSTLYQSSSTGSSGSSGSSTYLRKASGNATSAYLGIEIQDFDDSMSGALKLKDNVGVVITRVIPSSPADISGLKAGDIIIRFDRDRIRDSSEILSALKDEDPGDVVKIVVDRDGLTRTFYVELGSPASTYLQRTSLTSSDTSVNLQVTSQWGCTIAPLSDELISKLSIPADIKGVVVVSVSATGLAKASGIQTGDLITQVNRYPTPTLQTFYRSIEDQPIVVLEIYRAGRLVYARIQQNNTLPPLATIAGSVDDTTTSTSVSIPSNLPKRVAVASLGPNMDDMLAPYFGSAPYFIIVDITTKQFSVIQNNNLTGSGAYGIATVQLILSQGVTGVISENYGPQVYQALIVQNLQLFRAEHGKVSEALAQYESYLLSQVSNPTTQGMLRNMVPTGGAPFATDDEDDDEEQSGYKGLPYTIPPQGKYDPALDPANQVQSNVSSTQLSSGTSVQRRVAVAALGTDLKSGIAPLYGTAPYFFLFDTETKQYQVVNNPSITSTRSYGSITTQFLQSQNMGAVIAGNYGSRANTALFALNIIPYTYQGTVTDGVEAYRAGKLTPISNTSLPGYTYSQSLVPTGGAPFATDDDDEDEEQSGYKGIPYTIPPQGKYDPTLDPANAATSPPTQNYVVPQIVAIASTGNNLNASMAQVFRYAPYFLIVDIRTNQFSAIANPALSNTTIQPSSVVISQKAGATIAGMYGPVCYSLLVSNNVIPFTSNPGKVSDILNLYKAGALPRVSNAATQPQYQNQTIISTGGSPFASTEDDEEEEQSGYKGMPYNIPPQGKYDPALDPANAQTTAGSTQRADYCYCPYCQILVPHPTSVPCSSLSCPQCGNRMMNWDATSTTLVPQYQTIPQTIAGTLSGTSNYVQVPSLSQQVLSTLVPQTTYIQVPTQNQLRTGSVTDTSALLNLNQQTQYCYCPRCNVVYEHPRGIPCSSLTCTACGSRLISLNGGAINQIQQVPQVYQTTAGIIVSGQPATIPPMGQTTAGMPTSGQPATIPPMGQTTAGMPTSGQPATIPPMGQTTAGMPTSGQPATIPPMGQTTAGMPISGQPATIPPMGQTTAGMPTSGQPATIPPMGQTTAAISVAGQPFTTQTTDTTTSTMPPTGQMNFSMGANAPITQINPSGMNTQVQTTAGSLSTGAGVLQGTVDGNCVCPLCGTTVPHERGTACYEIPCPKCSTLMVREGAILNRTAVTAIMPTAGMPTAGMPTAGMPTAGMPTAGMPTAGMPTAGMPTAGMPTAGMPTAGMPTAGMPTAGFPTIPAAITIAGQPTMIPPAGTTTQMGAMPVTGIIDLPAMTIAGQRSGNVCIAATGKTIESQVADIFDKAPYFLIVGLGSIEVIPNPNVDDLKGSGVQSAQLIVSEGARVVLTNDIGIRAIEELHTLNVQVYTGIRGTAAQALRWYQDDRLTPTVLNNNKDSDDEEQHGPPSSSKSKSKGESTTSTSTKTL